MEIEKIIKKLNHKVEKQLFIFNLPEELKELFCENELVEIKLKRENSNAYEFLLLFAENMESLIKLRNEHMNSITHSTNFWLAYPKKSTKKYNSDLQRETIWNQFGSYCMEPVRQIAINDDWSAMRYKHVSKIKKMTRSFAASEEGKIRIEK
jgi:hypothetical protein